MRLDDAQDTQYFSLTSVIADREEQRSAAASEKAHEATHHEFTSPCHFRRGSYASLSLQLGSSSLGLMLGSRCIPQGWIASRGNRVYATSPPTCVPPCFVAPRATIGDLLTTAPPKTFASSTTVVHCMTLDQCLRRDPLHHDAPAKPHLLT